MNPILAQNNKSQQQEKKSGSMAKIFSLVSLRDVYLRYSLTISGLKSVTTDLGDGTLMHCWIPKTVKPTKPNLILIHGMGADAMWQWHDCAKPLIHHFNVYLPDLVFFGKSHTTLPDRTDSFQAKCVMGLMNKVHGLKKMDVVGISYGGFVGYQMAAQFPESVERLVLCGSGVCLEDKDMDEGVLFQVKSVDEAVSILLPQSVDKMMDLVRLTFHKPLKNLPNFFINDFLEKKCTEWRQEKKELIEALHRGRNLSDLPEITQSVLQIWGEYDKVFPLEMAHRLQRHVGDNVKLVVIKDVGHALNAECPKELYKHIKSYLTEPLSST